MAIQVKKLPVYSSTRDALVGALSLAERAFTDADFSYDPQSEYRKSLAVIDATLLQLRALAVNTLKEIDDAVAKGDLVSSLTKAARAAKKEADLLNQAAQKIERVAELVTRTTEVVTGIGRLPFL